MPSSVSSAASLRHWFGLCSCRQLERVARRRGHDRRNGARHDARRPLTAQGHHAGQLKAFFAGRPVLTPVPVPE